ncbi:MAG: tetratricopeptide repeat protein [Treponema sp.]|jgi:tetratricopeptide (TPR) repeat protein|nr:tetratricopeptide repeat protein [Treponema sp.]
MTVNKNMLSGVLVLAVIATIAVGIGMYKVRSRQAQLASQIIALGGGGTPVGIDDLRKAISLYEKKIEEHIHDAVKTQEYWKILVSRLFEKKLYGEVLEAAEEALHYNSTDPYLFYIQGVSATYKAKSLSDPAQNDERNRYFALSELSLSRAAELSPQYARPRYSLAVLYAFDLNRPAEAVFYAQQFLALSPHDSNGLFVLARAYFMLEQYQNAIQCYDTIIETSKDKQIIESAQENKAFVLSSR